MLVWYHYWVGWEGFSAAIPSNFPVAVGPEGFTSILWGWRGSYRPQKLLSDVTFFFSRVREMYAHIHRYMHIYIINKHYQIYVTTNFKLLIYKKTLNLSLSLMWLRDFSLWGLLVNVRKIEHAPISLLNHLYPKNKQSPELSLCGKKNRRVWGLSKHWGHSLAWRDEV